MQIRTRLGKEVFSRLPLKYSGKSGVELTPLLGCRQEDTPLGRVFRQFFIDGDEAYRNNRFKLIPTIVEGNYLVRKAVGSKPAILGTKLKQHYYKVRLVSARGTHKKQQLSAVWGSTLCEALSELPLRPSWRVLV
jgi:hypothetical protein